MVGEVFRYRYGVRLLIQCQEALTFYAAHARAGLNPCSSLRYSTVVVWLYVVLVGFCWCCLVEVFSGLVVDLGDDLLELFLGYGLEVGTCG